MTARRDNAPESQRADGRGHWRRGKPRTTLTPVQIAACLRKLNRALEDLSMREVAKVLGISDTQVGRIVRGHDLPSEATWELVRDRL